MVNSATDLDAVFRALADPTRRAMVLRLARGAATIGELGQPFSMTKPAITKHIKVLEGAGLLARSVEGRVHRCEIEPAALDVAQRWVDQVRAFWEGRLDNLAAFLKTTQPESEA